MFEVEWGIVQRSSKYIIGDVITRILFNCNRALRDVLSGVPVSRSHDTVRRYKISETSSLFYVETILRFRLFSLTYYPTRNIALAE